MDSGQFCFLMDYNVTRYYKIGLPFMCEQRRAFLFKKENPVNYAAIEDLSK